MAGPEAAAPVRSEAGHHEEVPGAADPPGFAARYGEVLEAGGLKGQAVDILEEDMGHRDGLVLLHMDSPLQKHRVHRTGWQPNVHCAMAVH